MDVLPAGVAAERRQPKVLFKKAVARHALAQRRSKPCFHEPADFYAFILLTRIKSLHKTR